MEKFKNIREMKAFCREKNISFTRNDKRNDLLDKIEVWEDIEIAKATKAVEVKKEEVVEEIKAFTAYEFGNLYKLDRVSIKYLERCFGKTKDSYDNWIQVCKDKKVID